ncbi:HEAT repeat domain-containing protein [Streptomyces sp. BH-SS-21]|uniref:HEAT repeat domain-containing protein n=1 Tax=Streptomyces liliiviolaceus TaxID=2823109 RepID=A0A941BC37_9ACTN|nr:HEAT repeat domain-containing protein [Streptomyces liliiviolaceus]MBQ0847994.1 HEAT repeat domain-containing protein [Streptomyces liliiviolaceus]
MTHNLYPGGPESGAGDSDPGPSPDALKQVIARGTSAIGAGGDATYNATGKGSTVQDNRTFVFLNGLNSHGDTSLPEEEIRNAFSTYAQQLRETYGRLDLEALIPTTEGEHPGVELSEVFVPPLLRADPPPVELPVELHRRLIEAGEVPNSKADTPQAPGIDRETWEQARQAYRERPAVKLLETLASAESGRVVLLGDPGAGKSTLTRYLALSLTSRALTGALEPLTGMLPVVVELRRYADANWRERSFEDFLAYIHEYEGHAPAPILLNHCLVSGQAVVVFDGLDELFEPRVRDDVTRRIKGFAARYPGIRVVVTSRVIGYNRHTLDAAGFRHYMIQTLDNEQISTFTIRWYEAVCPANKQESDRLRNRLSDAITRSRPVRELAGNPLLLTILAIIARRQRLPRDRAGVYQHAVNVLIAHWDEDTKHLELTPDVRAIADLDDRDRREMLERLARHMQSGEDGIAGNHVLGEEVEKVFTEYLRETLQLDMARARKVSRAMVKQFRERNFILSLYGSQVYGFVHRAFLEYLAASDIVRQYEQRELTDEELFDEIFSRHAPDPAWHEVLLLILGQLGEKVAASAIEKILALEADNEIELVAPPAVLALRALTEVRRIGALKEQSIKTAVALTHYWERNHVVPPNVAADTDASLNSLGPQWAGSRQIRRWLHVSGGGIRSSAAAYSLFTDMDVLSAIASRAWQPAARANALPHLARKWPQEDKVFRLAQDLALHDSADLVRSDALDVLAHYWTEDATVRELVQHRATEDPHQYVRRWAVFALASYWAEDPTVREFVQCRATEDPHEDVRSGALDALAEYWAEDPTVREFVQCRATEDPHEDVRSRALPTLAEYWAEDPTVREFVQCRATEDPHEDVRSRALPTLAIYWPEDPAVRELIEHSATQDPNEFVRSEALEALAQNWAEDPAVRELIQQITIQDSNEYVRSDALDALADHWTKDPAVRELVQHHATQDPHQYMRRWALNALATHWAKDATVRELIQHHATEDPHEDVRCDALDTLAAQWGEDPGTREFVEVRAAEDPHEKVRTHAFDVLAKYWTRNPIVEDLIRDLRARASRDGSDQDRESLVEFLTSSPYPEVRIVAAQILGSIWAADTRAVSSLREQESKDPDQRARKEIEKSVAMAEAYAPLYDRLW